MIVQRTPQMFMNNAVNKLQAIQTHKFSQRRKWMATVSMWANLADTVRKQNWTQNKTPDDSTHTLLEENRQNQTTVFRDVCLVDTNSVKKSEKVLMWKSVGQSAFRQGSRTLWILCGAGLIRLYVVVGEAGVVELQNGESKGTEELLPKPVKRCLPELCRSSRQQAHQLLDWGWWGQESVEGWRVWTAAALEFAAECLVVSRDCCSAGREEDKLGSIGISAFVCHHIYDDLQKVITFCYFTSAFQMLQKKNPQKNNWRGVDFLVIAHVTQGAQGAQFQWAGWRWWCGGAQGNLWEAGDVLFLGLGGGYMDARFVAVHPLFENWTLCGITKSKG